MPNAADAARDDLLRAILATLIALAEKVTGEQLSVTILTERGDKRRIYPGTVEWSPRNQEAPAERIARLMKLQRMS
jgi:hypothetical protein